MRLSVIPGLDIPLKNAEEFKFHTGTAEETGKLYLLEGKTLSSGESSLATIVLKNPVVTAMHDRFIIRRLSPAATVAGGEILALSESSEKPLKRKIFDRLNEYEAFMTGIDPTSLEGINKRIEYFIYANLGKESSIDMISKNLLLTKKMVSEMLDNLQKNGVALSLGQEYYIHIKCYNSLLENVRARIKTAFSENRTLTLSYDEVQKGLDCSSRLWKVIEEDIVKDGTISREANTFILRDSLENLSELEKKIVDILISVYEKTEFTSPRPDELPDIIHVSKNDIDKLMKFLHIRGDLIRLSENVVLSRSAFIVAQNIVVNIICRQGELDSGEFKNHINSSRKYALAILDHLDSLRITIRSGNIRKLSLDYERRLMQ